MCEYISFDEIALRIDIILGCPDIHRPYVLHVLYRTQACPQGPPMVSHRPALPRFRHADLLDLRGCRIPPELR